MSHWFRQMGRRLLIVVIALLGAAGLLSPTSVAYAAGPSVSLSISTLPSGYGGPLTVTATGSSTNFSQGMTVVYILQANGQDTHAASNFQVASGTSLKFLLASGLSAGNYTVEVETPVGTGLEVATAPLTVSPPPSVSVSTIGSSTRTDWLGVGYPSKTVTLTSNIALGAGTQVAVQKGTGTPSSANISSIQTNGNNVSFTLLPGLGAGSYNFVVTYNGQTMSTPFTVRNPQLAVTSQTVSGTATARTVTVAATNANFTSGSLQVQLSGGGETHTYPATATSDNQLTFVIPSTNFTTSTTTTSVNMTVTDKTEQITGLGYLSVVPPTLPTASITPASVPENYTSQAMTVATTNLNIASSNTKLAVTLAGSSVTQAVYGTASGSQYTFTLPTGLSVGTYTVTVNDGKGSASSQFSVTGVAPVITAPNSNQLSVLQGAAFPSLQLQATSDSTAPVTWALLKGTLPSGLSLSGSGVISGTVSATALPGSYPVTVQASSIYGQSTQQFTITVNAAKPVIQTTTLPNATQGQAYAQQLVATGTAPITWSVASGALPEGLSLNSSTGAISGTVSSTAELKTYTFTVQAQNSAGNTQQQLSITVAGSPVITTSTALTSATIGQLYSTSLTATGSTPITWSIASGSLPDGLTLDAATGAITGTVASTATATTYTFTVKATNSFGSDTKSITIVVSAANNGGGGTSPGSGGGAQPSMSASATLPEVTQGGSYSVNLTASGSTPLVWSIKSGTLPSGLSLNASSGAITVTDTAAWAQAKPGTYTFTVEVTNSLGSATQQDTLVIDAANGNVASVSGASQTIASQKVGVAGATVTAQVGSSSVELTVPQGAFTSDETVTLTSETNDSKLNAAIGSLLPSGETALHAIGVTFSGAAPQSAITLTISDASIKAGAVVYKVTDSGLVKLDATVTEGKAVISFSSDPYFVIALQTSQGPTKPTIETSALPSATQGNSYDAKLSAVGTSPITWSVVSGNLPDGLSLDASTGEITGTVSSSAAVGKAQFTVQATNSLGSATMDLTILVKSTPKSHIQISAQTLPVATASASYYAQLKAEGASSVNWSLVGGKLPSGLSLNENGTITGTVKSNAKSATFTVKAEDAQGNSDTHKFSITVSSKLGIDNVALATASYNTPYEAFLSSSLKGKTAWHIASGKLPAGLTLKGRVLKGTPKQAGKYTLIFDATHGKTTVTNTYTLEVGAPAKKAPYKDVKANAPYAAAIAEMSAKHFIWGYHNGDFRPNAVLTRAQFTGYLYQMLVDMGKIKEYRSKQPLYEDVKNGYYAYNQINTLAYYDYLDKTAKFNPNYQAEQWWVAQVLMSALGQVYVSTTPYGAVDAARLDGLWGITNSYRITRAETAQMLDEVYHALSSQNGSK